VIPGRCHPDGGRAHHGGGVDGIVARPVPVDTLTTDWREAGIVMIGEVVAWAHIGPLFSRELSGLVVKASRRHLLDGDQLPSGGGA